jgi:hypothetical protein
VSPGGIISGGNFGGGIISGGQFRGHHFRVQGVSIIWGG